MTVGGQLAAADDNGAGITDRDLNVPP